MTKCELNDQFDDIDANIEGGHVDGGYVDGFHPLPDAESDSKKSLRR